MEHTLYTIVPIDMPHHSVIWNLRISIHYKGLSSALSVVLTKGTGGVLGRLYSGFGRSAN